MSLLLFLESNHSFPSASAWGVQFLHSSEVIKTEGKGVAGGAVQTTQEVMFSEVWLIYFQ